LVQALLRLNEPTERRVEVILMSKNHPDVSLRVFHSINHYRLDISRAALTGGAPLGPYLSAFRVDLFLSQWADDVQAASNQGVAAGLIYAPPAKIDTAPQQIRIAFDGDCVLFSDEAQRVYDRDGLDAFQRFEEANASKELPDGPFGKLLRTLSQIQGPMPETSPVRVALVTDRSNPAHERVIRTLRAWGVRIDEAFFLGGIPKAGILKAFSPHMFFDDKPEYCELAAQNVPTSRVLLPKESVNLTVSIVSEAANGQDRFLLVCKAYLEAELAEWYRLETGAFGTDSLSGFLDEFEESVKSTPRGNERRASASTDTPKAKLMFFLENLVAKRRRS